MLALEPEPAIWVTAAEAGAAAASEPSTTPATTTRLGTKVTGAILSMQT